MSRQLAERTDILEMAWARDDTRERSDTEESGGEKQETSETIDEKVSPVC